jgi:hypothetical protein
VQKRLLLVVAGLLVASNLSAQYAIADPPLYLRWGFSAGPSTAQSSGRTLGLPTDDNCFSCPRVSEVVSGADKGSFSAALTASGIPSRLGIALRLETMFNRNTSAPYVSPPRTCVGLDCEVYRKAEIDDAWALVGGIDYAPLDDKVVAPYLTLGGGMALNRLKWRQDSSTTSPLSGIAIAFGPLALVGGGVRATFRSWAAFIEWRQFMTFVTPGSQMTPLSFGIQYRPRRAPTEGA